MDSLRWARRSPIASAKRLSFLEQRARLVEPRADAPAHVQDLRARRRCRAPPPRGRRAARAAARERAPSDGSLPGSRSRPPTRPRGGASARRRAPRPPPPSGARAAARARRGARRRCRSIARATAACTRAPPLAELAAERHLLRERMLERVLGDRIERLLVDELGAAQRRERRLQLARRQARRPPRAAARRKSLPITDAICSSRFSRSGRRSMRAASSACTVAGTSSRSIGVDQPVGAARRPRGAPTRSASARPPR